MKLNSVNYSPVGIIRHMMLAICLVVSTQVFYAQALTCSQLPTDQSWQLLVSPNTTTVCENTSVLFSVSTDSTYEVGILDYQWQRKVGAGNFTNLGTNNDSLTTSVTNNSEYRCIVSCGNGSNAEQDTIGPVTINVISAPNAGTLSGNQAICVNGTTTFSSNGDAGGAWTSNSNGVATVNSTTGVITGVSAGTATITYTVNGSGGCANATATRTVTVTAAPNAGTLSGNQAICVNGTTTFTSNGNAGGAWTSNSTGVATVNSTTGVISGVSAGTATITYTVNGSGGCANATATRTVTVTAAPNAGTLSGNQAICVNGTTTFTSNGDAGGAWTSNSTAVATVNSSTGVITGVSAGTATITYTVNGSGGCANATATRTVTVFSVTATFTSNTTTVCAGQQATLTISGTANALINYSVAGVPDQVTLNNTGTADITIATTTSGAIAVALVSGQRLDVPTCPTNLTATATVNVTSLPSATFTSSTSHCSGSSYTLQIVGTAGAQVQYTLTNQGGNTVTLNGAGSATVNGITLGVGSNTFQITQVSLGTCVNNTPGPNFTVNVTNTPSVTISPTNAPDALLCPGESVTLGSSTVGTAYTWRRGTTVVSSESTITVTQAGSYTVEVTAGACGGTSAPFSVTEVNNPTAAITNTGPTTFCDGGSVTLNASASDCSNCTFVWSTLSVAPSITVSTTSSITVTATNSNGCTDVSNPVAVQVNAIPTINLSQPSATICSGQSTTVTAQGASTYAWVNQDNASLGTSSGITLNSAGIYQVTGTQSGCSATASFELTVLPVPSGSISGTTSVCAGEAAAIAIEGTPNAIAYYHINSGGVLNQPLDGNGQAELLTNAAFTGSTLTYTLDSLAIVQSNRRCSSSSSGSATVTILPRPILQSIANDTYCNGEPTDSIILNESSSSPVQAAMFYWMFERFVGIDNGNSATQIPSGTAYNNSSDNTSACFVWGESAAGCYSDTIQFTITVTPGPEITSVEDVVLCDGSSFAPITLTTDIPATITWTAEGANIGLPSQGGAQVIAESGTLNYPSGAVGLQTAIITLAAVSAAGCTSDLEDPETFEVSVGPNPVSTTNNTFAFCDGDDATVVFTSDLANQYDWTLLPGGDFVGVSGIGSNVDTLNFTAVNADLTERSATIRLIPEFKYDSGISLTTCPGEPQDITIFINPTPALSFGTFDTFCSGANLNESSVDLQALPDVSNVTYTWEVENTGGLLSPSGGGVFNNVVTNNSNGTTIGQTNVHFTPSYANHGKTCQGDIQTILVKVYPLPSISSSPGDQFLCSGETATIDIAGLTSNPVTNWSFEVAGGALGANPINGGDVSDVLTYSGGIQSSLTYTITPSIVEGLCQGNPVEETFTVYALPATPSLLASSSPDPCPGAQGVQLWADTTAEGVTLYEWTLLEPNTNGWTLDYGGTAGGIQGSFAYVNVPAAGGTLTYQLTAENANDCRSYAQYELVVAPGTALPDYSVVIVNPGSAGAMLAVVPAIDGQTYQWGSVDAVDWDDAVLSGETSQFLFVDPTFEPLTQYYFVDVTNGDCVSRVFFNQPESLIPQWVSQTAEASALIVFPNPFNDVVNLSGAALRNARYVQVYDVMGRMMTNRSVMAGTERMLLETEAWPAGAYFIYVGGDWNVQVTKLLKR